ncbi:coiled-coil domain-containing protein 27 [Rana temporaria]|uniref:coiled-coil domain-containing protein 27 n=1 Tax=Rana temporaria TaxID=8407 RepID=UPI001AAD9F02|nr:coiled-coil domain-containing protein 27 [Rana temporaria]
MKDKSDWKMQTFHDLQWTGVRRPQTARWRIPKSDSRREKYSKSAQEPLCSYEAQSLGFSSSTAFSFESIISSQVTDLQSSGGSHHGYCKNGGLPMDRKLPHIHSSADPNRSSIWDGSSPILHHIGTQSPQTYLTSVEIKAPWYISVLHEKERCLLKLGEEINRLSRFEVETKRKDQIISTLRIEISELQSDLQHLSRPPHTGREEDSSWVERLDDGSLHSTNGFPEFEECPPTRDVTREVLNSPTSPRDPFRNLERNVSTISLAGSFSELQRELQSPQMGGEQILHDDEIAAHTLDGEKTAEPEKEEEDEDEEEEEDVGSVDDSQEQIPEVQKLQEELEVIRKDYNISQGVISSLQRTISSHQSKLRKCESEKEDLQRTLLERGAQLQAMSSKFSSMREERKHEEVMAAMEKENYDLRELVSEMRSEVSRRNDLIGELKSDAQRLQREVLEVQSQVRKKEGEKNRIESKAGELATSEQRARVTLEALQSRFERFRSKIIQAAYTAPGFRGPQVEVPDNDILETMQKIIAERSDFHQQLKQKGVKVPPLHQSETSHPAAKHPSSRKKAQ